ncbi:hypothetical protein IFM89_026878 [Coptis chinensis]|uniref:Uncharacterized protein n=1 Tax=Coptis chinensis TaxID=261450 RepID=A0A835LNS0_9MAGN|nr:hypothetical protein IFM89_026878 [Coptis chinensis]
MKGRGLRKLPGCSWITISNETHSFRVANKTHPCSPVIYRMLDDLIVTMKGSTNVPYFDGFCESVWLARERTDYEEAEMECYLELWLLDEANFSADACEARDVIM